MLISRFLSLASFVALAFVGLPFAPASAPAFAQTPPAPKPAPTAAPAKAAPAKPAPAKPSVKAAAPAAAAAAAALTPGQLDAAQRVMTGHAQCEFDEHVEVAGVEGKPGHFVLKHKAVSYNLVPEETTTGAVRLEDKARGIMWLQIPSKSMLMNSRIGQRMVDNCQMAQQKG